MTMTDWDFYLRLIEGGVLPLGAYVYAWWTSRNKEMHGEFTAIRADIAANKTSSDNVMSAFGTRMTVIESQLKEAPTKDDLHAISLSIAALGGQINVLSERLKPVAAIADRLQELQLEESKTARKPRRPREEA